MPVTDADNHDGKGSPSVSVVIVSRGRPRELSRCLKAVAQLAYVRFEVVVVADPAGLAALGKKPFSDRVTAVACDEPNISLARNLGVTAAGGEIIAFIDDDSVPEPTWLTHLANPFSDPSVAAAVGSVRGRNGISFQSRIPCVNDRADTMDCTFGPMGWGGKTCPAGYVPKLVGTNMALRRKILEQVGGFDEAYQFFLEDTDMSLRLANNGLTVAFAPYAQVHHGFAPSVRRASNRRPLDLHDIGRSLAVFLSKFAQDSARVSTFTQFRKAERERLVDHMVRGNCEPRDVLPMLRTLDEGFRDGTELADTGVPKIPPAPNFRQFRSAELEAPSALLSGPVWAWRKLHRRAIEHLSRHDSITLMVFSPTALFHHVTYTEDGYWLHTGGIFGRSVRDEPVFRLTTLNARVKREWNRIRTVRRRMETTDRP